jgi:hypothetical protein
MNFNPYFRHLSDLGQNGHTNFAYEVVEVSRVSCKSAQVRLYCACGQE